MAHLILFYEFKCFDLPTLPAPSATHLHPSSSFITVSDKINVCSHWCSEPRGVCAACSLPLVFHADTRKGSVLSEMSRATKCRLDHGGPERILIWKILIGKKHKKKKQKQKQHFMPYPLYISDSRTETGRSAGIAQCKKKKAMCVLQLNYRLPDQINHKYRHTDYI